MTPWNWNGRIFDRREKQMFKRSLACLLVTCFLVSLASTTLADNNYVVVPAQNPFVSAESRLKDFAKKAEDSRMQTAMYGVGLGLLYMSLGAAYSSSSSLYYSSSNYSAVYYGLGAGMAILGVRSYLYPTELENNYAKTRQMQAASVDERAVRESFAEKSLKQGADEAR